MLTPREFAVCEELLTGKSYKAIAQVLCIAPTTVRKHIQNIHQKLGAHTNAEVAARVVAMRAPASTPPLQQLDPGMPLSNYEALWSSVQPNTIAASASSTTPLSSRSG